MPGPRWARWAAAGTANWRRSADRLGALPEPERRLGLDVSHEGACHRSRSAHRLDHSGEQMDVAGLIRRLTDAHTARMAAAGLDKLTVSGR